MMRSTKMNYSQTYIPHGYKELIMPAKGYHDVSNIILFTIYRPKKNIYRTIIEEKSIVGEIAII